MNIETKKLNIIKWVSELNDRSLLEKIEKLKPIEADWWEKISDDERFEIETGLAEADRGEFKTTDEVLAAYKKWDIR
jgi:predicted transcriptional regulator